MTQDDWLADPQYREAVADLLGALAYGELTAFTRLAGDSELSPTQPLKAAVAALAVAEFRHYEHARGPAARAWASTREAAMAPFIAADRRLPRADPAQHLARGAGQGLRRRRHRHRLLPRGRRLRGPLHPRAGADSRCRTWGRPSSWSRWSARRSAADPRIAGRLALWGRRLVGEALSQAQQVAVERDALASLLVGGAGDRPRRAPTSPSWAGCSPGSPTSTPADGSPRPGRLTCGIQAIRGIPRERARSVVDRALAREAGCVRPRCSGGR